MNEPMEVLNRIVRSFCEFSFPIDNEGKADLSGLTPHMVEEVNVAMEYARNELHIDIRQ